MSLSALIAVSLVGALLAAILFGGDGGEAERRRYLEEAADHRASISWGPVEEWEKAVESATAWVAPPRPPRLPAVGETWRGVDHGSLFKVLAVGEDDDGYTGVETWVTYLVMYQGNPAMTDRMPGVVARARLEGWLTLLEYAPEWNEPGM